MKFNFSKEWFMSKALLEEGCEISADNPFIKLPMKIIVISSRDPDVYPGMEGEAEPRRDGTYLVALKIKRTTISQAPVECISLQCMESHEIKFVEPQIPI